ncbi:MAG: sulfatase-like hydrolase/transferase [Eggerthellaceae bacterium]|nr:sulfatase-like hydrolase/transferase [Eggerthellaceae bacterium]
MTETAPTNECTPSTEGDAGKGTEAGIPEGALSTYPKTEAAAVSKPWKPNKALLALGLLVIASCSILFFTEMWLFATWESLSVDEILYHLRTSLEGTNSSMISDYLLHYGTRELAIVVISGTTLFLTRKRKVVYRMLMATLVAISVGAVSYAVYDLDKQIGLIDYLQQPENENTVDFIESHYVDPSHVEIAFPEQKRNVIYLMLESMEVTYADIESGGAFERNVIPELTKLAQLNEDFSGTSSQISGALCLPGCTWTMGAMFALTSGLPLKLPLSGNQLETADSFYPGITAMGDILADEGYTQELLIGSDAVFGGRELYFTQHGDFNMNDYAHAQETGLIPEGYKVFWGYEDARLFDIAKRRLTELAAQDEPFNLTMLTVDTHFEDGYVCEACDSEFGGNQYANVMACSSRQVAEFIEWVQRQPFYDNTTIVICGDHTTMDSDFCEGVPSGYDRRVFTAVVNGAAQVEEGEVARRYSTLDLFPTALAAMGAQISGDKLGLGVNLYSSTPTLVELYGLDACEAELSKQSDFMNAFSEVVITEENLMNVREKATLSAKTALGLDPDWLKSHKRDINLINEDVNEVDLVLHRAPAGKVIFILEDCYSLNPEAIIGAELTVTDMRTGKTTELPLSLVQNRPNYFWHICITDFNEEDLPHLTACALLSLEGFDRFEVASCNVCESAEL